MSTPTEGPTPTPQDAAMAELRDATEAERAAYNALIAGADHTRRLAAANRQLT